MPDWSAPLWLVGLAVIPLVWWLHRFRRQGTPHYVSALFLWSGPAATADTHSRPSRADPWWRLRALLIALLVLGLAGPHWPGDSAQIVELWFDDSPSMQTLEDGTPRTQLAQAAVGDALARSDTGEVLVHSLSDPARQLRLDPRRRDEWTTRLGDWLQTGPAGLILPPVRQMSPQHEHWLVSDGADTTLAGWLESVPVGRVIQVGRQTENVTLRRLSLRPDRPDAIRGLAGVENLGQAAATRRLVIDAGGRTIAAFAIDLAAGEWRHYDFTLDTVPAGPVQARLSPADSLPDDDALAVDPQSFAPRPAQIGDACGPHLRAALAAHPGLRIVGHRQSAALRIVCGASPPPHGAPAIWLHTTATPAAVTVDPLWQTAAGPLRHLVLQPSWLRHFATAQPPAGTPLLRAGETPLVVYRPLPAPQVEVLLDAEFPPWVRRPEYPLFLAGLIDRVLDRPMLDTFGSAARPREASLIGPHPLRATAVSPPRERVVTAGRDLGLYCILGAALLLGLDLRRRLHGATPTPGESPP